MPPELLKALAQLATTSPLLVVFCWYIWRLTRDLKASQDARVAEALNNNTKILALYEKTLETTAANMLTLQATKQSLVEVRSSMEDMEEVLLEFTRVTKPPTKK